MKEIILGGRYKLLEKVGGGGMAIVYKAKCQLLNRFVAVKVLRDEFIEDEEFIKKFRQESQAAASLSHPNIVNVYDVGVDEIDDSKIYYIVMEYIDGKTLKEIIREKGQLSVAETVEYAIEMGEAIEHAHRNHIVHRDIKPHNIMIDKDNRVKVTDFGIARAATSSTLTNTSNVIGSVHYFSPEQARGGFTDSKSDIYSLGIVMYEMITGRLPYEGDTPVSVALKHVQEEIPLVRKVNPKAPEGLEFIIKKATEKNPIDRYQSAEALVKDLRDFQAGSLSAEKFEAEELLDSPTQIIDPIAESQLNEEKEKDMKKEDKKNHKKTNKEKKSGGLRVILLAVLSALLVTSLGAFAISSLRGALKVKEVEVPDLLGMEEAKAEEELAKRGLKFAVGDRVSNKDYKEGQIVFQNIKAGEKVKEGYTIEVDVSKGVNHVKVPKLISRDIKDFEDILKEYGLERGSVSYEYSDTIDEDLIIEQYPAPYSEVEENTEVNIIVSQGTENKLISMPKLVGLAESDAKAALVAKGLSLSSRNDKHSSEYPKGVVIWQSIDPGMEVSPNTEVNITVSLGEEPKEEPVEEEPKEPEEPSIPFNLELNLPGAEESTSIQVVRHQNGQKETVYTGTADPGETSITINLDGNVSAKFDVFLNGDYYSTISHPDR